MSDSTNSPTPTPLDSSSSYANDPLLTLLTPKPLHKMSQDEIRVQVNSLRSLRVSAQSLGRALRETAAKDAAKPPVKHAETLDDALKGLGL
jgi:hypothetical protein